MGASWRRISRHASSSTPSALPALPASTTSALSPVTASFSTWEPESFDAAISRVGMIYFPDQQEALRRIYRALRPGGSFAAVVYSTPENNGFFSLPVSIIRDRAQLPPPLPGQPGPFSLGSPGVLEETLRQAGFRDVVAETVAAPLRMSSAAECLRFERESFGALHQMLSSLERA